MPFGASPPNCQSIISGIVYPSPSKILHKQKSACSLSNVQDFLEAFDIMNVGFISYSRRPPFLSSTPV